MADPCPWCHETPCGKTCRAGDLPAASVFWIAFLLTLIVGFVVLVIAL